MIGGQARGIREATSRRSVQKVNRLPWLLVLLTNFSIHRSLPPPFSLPLLFLPLLYPSPCPPPLLQLISSRPRRSSTPMFGELLIPTTRDSPLFLVPLSVPPQNPLGRYSFYFFYILTAPAPSTAPARRPFPPSWSLVRERNSFFVAAAAYFFQSHRTTCAHPPLPPSPGTVLPRRFLCRGTSKLKIEATSA